MKHPHKIWNENGFSPDYFISKLNIRIDSYEALLFRSCISYSIHNFDSTNHNDRFYTNKTWKVPKPPHKTKQNYAMQSELVVKEILFTNNLFTCKPITIQDVGFMLFRSKLLPTIAKL